MASFKNPLGEVVERDESEIFSFDGVDSHKAIDKGDGSFLTSGYPKDAEWTADRIAEGDRLGLNTSGWWDAAPDYIQGKINASKREALAKAATTTAPRRTPPKPVRTVPTGPTPAELEQAKKEAWEKAKAALRGPTNWTQYWNAARKAEGNTGLPKWLVALNSNQRLPAFTGFGSIPKPQMLTTYEDFQPDSYRYVTPRPSDWIANLDPGVRDSIQVPGPLQITPGQWANLLPSERQGLQGLVESQGGSFDDWAATLRRGWPQWNRSPRTRFGGGF